jgi:putative ABC transport system ATP-binding protein
MSYLELQHVTFKDKNRNRKILDNLSLVIEKGDFVILLGSNGSGKTSLIRLIQGLYRPSQGKLLFENEDLAERSLDSIARDIITLTQDMAMTTFEGLTVLENCLMATLRHQTANLKISQKTERAFFKDYLKDFHRSLPGHLDTPTGHLSGGERQLLSLGLCLLNPPKILLLDEHTSALDPRASALVLEKTMHVIQGNKITALMTTHKIEQALSLGNRLIVMKDGKIIEDIGEKDKKKLKEKDIWSFYEETVSFS